jgi:hypothetical protein
MKKKKKMTNISSWFQMKICIDMMMMMGYHAFSHGLFH